jgi:prepilin-type N-terminal cleavage/methylation domain-containing protein
MRRSSAFTLIEVMAAVLLLALFVASISGMLVRAQAQEGDARRRAEIDETVLRGGALALGSRETREGELIATTTIAAFEPAALQPATAEGEDGEREAPAAAVPVAGSWLSGPNAKADPPIFEVSLRVSWDGAPLDAETQLPYSVKRRTFALNPAALEKLASSDAGEAGDPADEGGDE